MKKTLSEKERGELNARVVDAEKKTGAEIVLAVIKRSDTYAELPWKAFALGISSAGIFVFALDGLLNVWTTPSAVLINLVIMLVTGSAFALGAVFVHPFARLFLTAHRAEMEVRQYAQSLFLSRELFATKNRQAVLLLVSLFEKQIIVLPDTGISKRLSPEGIQEIIARMTPSLAAGRVSCALADGLDRLVENLAGTAKDAFRENEIADEIIEEKRI